MLKLILWMRFAILTSRLGLGLDHGVLLVDLITRHGSGEAAFGYSVDSGKIWNGQGIYGGSI